MFSYRKTRIVAATAGIMFATLTGMPSLAEVPSSAVPSAAPEDSSEGSMTPMMSPDEMHQRQRMIMRQMGQMHELMGQIQQRMAQMTPEQMQEFRPTMMAYHQQMIEQMQQLIDEMPQAPDQGASDLEPDAVDDAGL